MSSENNITRGGLSGKMDGYQPVPPQSVWEGVTSAMRVKRSNRKLFIILGAAAGLALAVTVGISLFSDAGQPGIAMNEETMSEQPGAATRDEISGTGAGPGASNGEQLNSGDEQTGTSAPSDTGAEQPGVVKSGAGLNEQAGDTGEDALNIGSAYVRSDVTQNPVPEQGTVGKRSRFEEKVVIALQEVQEENQAEGEMIAEDDKVAEQTGTVKTGDEGEGTQLQLPPENDTSVRVVNEDSLVRLLQDEEPELPEPESIKSGKWQLGAIISPLISYRDVASLDAAQNVAVNNSESARLTYGGGVQISYLPNDRLTIQTGVQYNKMGVNIGDYSSFKSGWFQSEMDMVTAPSRMENVVSISNSMGTVVSGDNDLFVNSYSGTGTLTDYHMLIPEEMIVADASVESFSQTFEYLEIPFNVRYKVLDRNFDLQLMGGFSTNLLVNNSVSAVTGDEVIAIGEVQDVRMFNYSGNAGLGVVYDVFENFSLSIEPRFRYFLNSINKGNLPVTRPYTFGFYTGVNYKF
jgi:hypothetical protein